MSSIWQKMPLSRVAIPFIAGIFCALELKLSLYGLEWWLLAFCIISILLLTLLKPSQSRNTGISLFIISSFFLCGAIRGQVHEERISESALTQTQKDSAKGYLLEIKSSPIEKKNSFKVDVIICGILTNDNLVSHNEKSLLYIPKLELNDSLFTSKYVYAYAKPSLISPPKNPKEFDYQKYLSGLGVQHQFYLKKENIRFSDLKKEKNILTYFEDFRDDNLKMLNELGITDDSYSVISALVFGQKDRMDKKLYAAYGAAGATHVLAVSGLHVGLIYVILAFLTKFLVKKRFGKWFRLIFILLGLWSYAAITGFSPSVLRASTMFSFITIASLNNSRSNIYNTIAGSAIGLLLLSPNLLMEVGFQLSYCAVLGILFIQPYLYELFSFKNYLGDKAWQITTVSIAAQLGTFPLAMLYFHQFPNYFILSNLFVIPVATFILYFTLVVLAVGWFHPAAEALATLLNYVVSFLNFTIKKMEALPYAKTEGIDITILECFILYFIIILVFSILIGKRFKLLIYTAALAVTFAALQLNEKRLQMNQSELTIHVINKERVISILNGEKCYCICNANFKNEKDKIQFHLSHYWDERGIKEIQYVNLTDQLQTSSFILAENLVLFKKHLIVLDPQIDVEIENDYKVWRLLDDHNHNSKLNSKSQYLLDGKTKHAYKFNEMPNCWKLDYALTLQ